MKYCIHPGISIIIPIFKERENLPEVIQQISSLKHSLDPLELIFVDDDSQDGTYEYLNSLRQDWIKVIFRKNKRSLSTAVIDGFNVAQYPLLICMDGDLSHPISAIPDMIKIINDDPNVDFVLGSRFVAGGKVDPNWTVMHRFNAFIAKIIAKMVVSLKDPMSGFFCLRKSTYQSADKLDPIGYKIGLELIIKCKCKKIVEMPIHFMERSKGKSKLNFRVRFEFLLHILQLLCYQYGSAKN